jgi:hypothetical protein
MKIARRVILYLAVLAALASVALGFLPIDGADHHTFQGSNYAHCDSLFLPPPDLDRDLNRSHSCNPPRHDRLMLVLGTGVIAVVLGGLWIVTYQRRRTRAADEL